MPLSSLLRLALLVAFILPAAVRAEDEPEWHPVEVEEVPSLADSLGGGIGMQNRLSFPMCRDLLGEIGKASGWERG